MERKYNVIEQAVETTQVLKVKLTDEQITKAFSEIYKEQPIEAMGNLVAYASEPNFSTPLESELDDSELELH